MNRTYVATYTKLRLYFQCFYLVVEVEHLWKLIMRWIIMNYSMCLSLFKLSVFALINLFIPFDFYTQIYKNTLSGMVCHESFYRSIYFKQLLIKMSQLFLL